MNIGKEMYGWACDLFPICRSITGEGVRKTLLYIQEVLPKLEIRKVKSGTKVLAVGFPLGQDTLKLSQGIADILNFY